MRTTLTVGYHKKECVELFSTYKCTLRAADFYEKYNVFVQVFI